MIEIALTFVIGIVVGGCLVFLACRWTFSRVMEYKEAELEELAGIIRSLMRELKEAALETNRERAKTDGKKTRTMWDK